ncbi:MAG: hypothetical protein N2Z22_04435 [Turneriella sp.]|nr:hypothetical protein [Turneriella sp.]
MALKNDLVQVAPKLVCWYGMPVLLNEAQRMHLLLHDIYIYPVINSELPALPQLNGRTTAYVFSFDHYAPLFRAFGDSQQLVAARKLASYINTFCSHNSVVFSRTLSPRLEEIFQQAEITFVQRDLTYEKPFFQFLRDQVLPLFHGHERRERHYIRVVPKEVAEFRVFVRSLGRPADAMLTAKLNNVSLNGIGLKMLDIAYRRLELRDAVQVTLRSPKTVVRINCAFVTRINSETDELAVNFNLNDKSFIEPRDAQQLQRLVLQTLEQGVRIEITKKPERILPDNLVLAQ